ncbi:uncharacterized protein [Anolis sagrei]|uniref:uncharacterized protein n=1 Tax=Anolis sagrei TaxID=38937 RepID=UPI00351FF83B
MPSKKNRGGPKGKGPAEKTGHKRPLRPDGSSSDEDGVSMEDLEALLQRVNQIEQNRGVGLGGAGSGPTRRASKKQLFKSLLSRVSIIESTSAAEAERVVRLPEQLAVSGAAGGSSLESSAVQNITSPEGHPSVQASSGSSAAAVAGPSQPTALASTSSAVAGSTQSVGSSVAAVDVAGREQLVTAVPAESARLAHRWRILVCGHSYVHWAERYARNSSFGQHLGCASTALVEWKGVRGLRWDGLVPLLFQDRSRPTPDVLVLHIGGNDLGLLNGRALYLQARADILKIWQAWPRVHIAWSAIIPRLRWPGGGDVRKLEKARKRVNRAMRTALARGRGSYIPHKDITHDKAQFYRSDGVHLTDLGNAQFLADLQLGIQEVLRGLVGDGGEMDICPQSVA